MKTVGILGAGAIGSYILWGLSNKEDINCIILAEGKRKEKLKEGLLINTEHFDLNVKEPGEIHLDLLIVSLKYNALLDSLEDIKKAVSEDTIVMSLMNGVDSEEIIGNVIGEDKVVPSYIKIASQRIENQIIFNPDIVMGIFYGEENRTSKCDQIHEIFNGSKLRYTEVDNILYGIWEKFRLNVTHNLPQAMIGCGIGAYRDSEHVAFIQQKLREEVNQIALAKGIDLDGYISSYPKGAKGEDCARYSTLQDLDAKRHTEIDMFAGTLIKMGKEYNIPTPYSEMTYHIIKALEEKNDGKFNY